MTSFRRPSPPFGRGRADARSIAERRGWWLETLERACQVGTAAATGETMERDAAALFSGLVVRTSEIGFPLPAQQASAEAARNGFVALARGFIAAAQPEVKATLGEAMAAAASCCRRMIEIDVASQAQAWRRRHGGLED